MASPFSIPRTSIGSPRDCRRGFRRDLEGTGNGYLEVIRSADDTVVMLNSASAEEMRLIRLDEAVSVTKTRARKSR
jgi:capsid portal protein